MLPPEVIPVSSLADAVEGAEFVVAAVPSHGLRDVMRAAAPFLSPDAVIVSATKGIEAGSLRRMSQVVCEETGGRLPVVVLSGPSFASEVARGLPAAVLAASSDAGAAARVQDQFRGPGLRLYASDDVPGVEIGGALKNVIAIATGMAQGLGVGDNTRAAVLSRGLAELTTLAVAMGGEPATLAGLAGVGDLVATCMSPQSRNRHVGEQLGLGRSLEEILGEMRMVAEGVKTVSTVVDLADQHGLHMPIARTIHDVVTGRIRAADAYRGLSRAVPAGHESQPG
jgi:glycerol-3-phosphate dehydrogenase (NAD(P)+)